MLLRCATAMPWYDAKGLFRFSQMNDAISAQSSWMFAIIVKFPYMCRCASLSRFVPVFAACTKKKNCGGAFSCIQLYRNAQILQCSKCVKIMQICLYVPIGCRVGDSCVGRVDVCPVGD